MVQISLSVIALAIVPLLVTASPIAQPAPAKGSVTSAKGSVRPPSTPASKGSGAALIKTPVQGAKGTGQHAKGSVHPQAKAILAGLRAMKKGEFKPYFLNQGKVPVSSKHVPKAPAPKHLKGLPEGTHMIAHDPESGQLRAFGKGMKFLGSVPGAKGATKPSNVSPPARKTPAKMVKQKRDGAGSCFPLTADDVQKCEPSLFWYYTFLSSNVH
jgi:hypothetical protein